MGELRNKRVDVCIEPGFWKFNHNRVKWKNECILKLLGKVGGLRESRGSIVGESLVENRGTIDLPAMSEEHTLCFSLISGDSNNFRALDSTEYRRGMCEAGVPAIAALRSANIVCPSVIEWYKGGAGMFPVALFKAQ